MDIWFKFRCETSVCVRADFFLFLEVKNQADFDDGAVYNISERKDVMWEKSPLNFVTRTKKKKVLKLLCERGRKKEKKKATFTLLVRTANWRALKMGEINIFFQKKTEVPYA